MKADGEKRKLARNADDFAEIEKVYPYLTFPARYLELAKKHIDDPAAFHCLRYVVIEFSRKMENRETIQAALELLAKHHAEHPDMRGLMQSLTGPSKRLALWAATAEEARLARAVLEKNRDAETKALACSLL